MARSLPLVVDQHTVLMFFRRVAKSSDILGTALLVFSQLPRGFFVL